jgi:hypothetical protein
MDGGTPRDDATTLLLPDHRALIEASSISSDVARLRGYWSATEHGQLLDLGYAPYQIRVPALVVPVYAPYGELVWHQIRPDHPRRNSAGKDLKYESPAGTALRIDVPPPVRHQIDDPRVPLLVTEGVRKADSAASRGLCVLALPGVYGFRGTNAKGGKVAHPDLEYVAFNGRPVFLAFDSDVTRNPAVLDALTRLAALARARGSAVSVITLPEGPNGAKVGLDDYFAAGHSADDLFALARPFADEGFGRGRAESVPSQVGRSGFRGFEYRNGRTVAR